MKKIKKLFALDAQRMTLNAKGFTLIELAIVLVIIGIILGAVMKGQDLIENARHKKFANNVKQFEVLTWGFMDRKGYFPGDSNSDGKIDANPQTDFTTNARFLDAPTTNAFTIGSYTFYIFFGNDNTGTLASAKNIITVCKANDCNTAFDGPELAYAEAFDTSIDGTSSGTGGRVVGTINRPGNNPTSATWLATYAAGVTSSTYTPDSTKAVLYYFDRK